MTASDSETSAEWREEFRTQFRELRTDVNRLREQVTAIEVSFAAARVRLTILWSGIAALAGVLGSVAARLLMQ